MSRATRARRAAIAKTQPTQHHVQARVSEDVRIALAKISAERGVTQSEIVRDLIEAGLFGSEFGATLSGPDQGYRIAKSTAGVIARKALHAAFEALPDEWASFKKMIDREGI